MKANVELSPRLLHMSAACTYTARSRWTLRRAVRAGELRAAGRNRRSMTFERTELDRWMIGEPSIDSAPPIALARRSVTGSGSGSGPNATSSSSSNALARIRRIAREGAL